MLSPAPRRFTLLLLCWFCVHQAATAQMMAHPGWRGNSISNGVWWRDTILVRAAPGTKLSDLQDLLQSMVQIGADGLILPPLSGAGADLTEIDPALGDTDALDALLREASARRIHVVADLPYARLTAPGTDAPNIVRFWLSRGMAGVDIGNPDSGSVGHLQMRALRSVVDHFNGERVLMEQGPPAPGKTDPVMLYNVPAENAALMNYVAAQVPARNIPTALELRVGPDSQAILAASTLLLISHGPAVIDVVSIGDPAKHAEWLHQILAMRRTNAALRGGKLTFLKTGAPNMIAVLVRPAAPSQAQPPLLVLANETEKPVTLALEAPVEALHLRGHFLRALLRNDGGTGPMSLNDAKLAPHSLFVGELRY